MKRNTGLLLAFALLLAANLSLAQTDKKSLKKETKTKAVKEARKEAKAFEKEGYAVAPGALPMEKQIETVAQYVILIASTSVH